MRPTRLTRQDSEAEGLESRMIEREISFDARAHSVDAIQRAIYKLSDRLSCDLSVQEGSYRCKVHFAEMAEADVEELLANLRNEVLDETLRERIRSETQETRNLILAIAFANTGLVDSTDA